MAYTILDKLCVFLFFIFAVLLNCKKCSGIKGSMYKAMKSSISRGCSNPVGLISTGRSSVDIGASANLEVVDKFCYLGDMLSVDRDAMEARI